MASTTQLPRDTLLLGRFELAVESDFTVYRRRLSAPEELAPQLLRRSIQF